MMVVLRVILDWMALSTVRRCVTILGMSSSAAAAAVPFIDLVFLSFCPTTMIGSVEKAACHIWQMKNIMPMTIKEGEEEEQEEQEEQEEEEKARDYYRGV